MNVSIKTTTEQIYQIIRDDILFLRRRPGEKMLLKNLQEQLGVSSTPIREALVRLQQDGLIDYQPNIGMSVIHLTSKDIEEIYDLMVELDVLALKLAYRGEKREEFVKELRKGQIQAMAFIQTHDTERWEEWSDTFHLLFFTYADNRRLSEAAKKVRIQFTIFSNAYQQAEENQWEIQQQHEEIVVALEQGDLDKAVDLLYRHVQASRQKAMDVLKAYDELYFKG